MLTCVVLSIDDNSYIIIYVSFSHLHITINPEDLWNEHSDDKRVAYRGKK